MAIVEIDWTLFSYYVIGIFGLVGFLRGWFKEALTTGLLILLLVFINQPGLAEKIIEQINKVLSIIFILFETRSLEINQLAATAAQTPDIPIRLDPLSQRFWITALIVLITLSYFVGRGASRGLTPSSGAKLFGGIIGVLNGFIIINLVREYIAGRFFPNAVTAQAAPNAIAVQVTDLPPAGITEGFTPWIVIALGIVVFFVALTNRYQVQRTKVTSRPPIGYTGVKPAPPPIGRIEVSQR